MATTPGLEALRGSVPDQQALEDALFQRAMMDINEQKEKYFRAEEEKANARGLRQGLGINDYVTALRTQAEGEFAKATERARLDAFTAAMKARQAALSDVAGKEAQHRGMDISESNARRANKTAKSGQMMQAGAGVGAAGLGVIGRTFGDDIKGGLRNMVGLGGDKGAAAPGRSFADNIGSSLGVGRPSLEDLTPAGPDLSGIGQIEDMNLSAGSSMPDFEMPSMDFDLSSLFGGSDGNDWISELLKGMA